MIRNTIGILFLLLASVSSAHALYYTTLYDTVGRTDACDGTGQPLPESCIGVIFWDENLNGPDSADIPAPVGPNYSPGFVNFNTFPINGSYCGFPPGGFCLDPLFILWGDVPPRTYYVVIECEGVRWTSRTFTPTLLINDIFLSEGWTCEVAAPDTCERFYGTDFFWESLIQQTDDHRHYSGSYCLWLCANRPLIVQGFMWDFVGPIWAYGTVSAGCGESTPCNSGEVTPTAQPIWQNGTTTTDLMDCYWDPQGGSVICENDTILSPVDGWVCLFIDLYLPVEQGSFDAVSGDSEVRLQWNTLSETGIERFELMRSSSLTPAYEPVASIPAENSSSGAQYGFVDREVTNDVTYAYTLAIVNLDGSRQEWGTEVSATPHAEIVSEFALHQNFPNPFNPETRIAFDLAADANVTLEVFNVSGQVVATLLNGTMEAGSHSVSFDGSALSAGVYFYTLRADGFTATKKMLLLK